MAQSYCYIPYPLSAAAVKSLISFWILSYFNIWYSKEKRKTDDHVNIYFIVYYCYSLWCFCDDQTISQFLGWNHCCSCECYKPVVCLTEGKQFKNVMNDKCLLWWYTFFKINNQWCSCFELFLLFVLNWGCSVYCMLSHLTFESSCFSLLLGMLSIHFTSVNSIFHRISFIFTVKLLWRDQVTLIMLSKLEGGAFGTIFKGGYDLKIVKFIVIRKLV